jgi:phage tail-like protein
MMLPGTGVRIDPLTTHGFSVQIGQSEQAVFSEFSGLEAKIEVFPYEEGGCNDYVRKFPTRTSFSNITLKRGVASTDELWSWFQETMNGNVVRQNVSVVLYNAAHDEVKRWNFVRVFPVKWVGPTFKAGENAISIETLELAHEGMTVSK